jgi:hydrogenase maturation protease
MKTIVLGLGNDIMSDDAAGVLVARCIKERIAPGVAEVVEASFAAWRLIDILRGYDKAVIIDAIVSVDCLPGEVCVVDLKDIRSMHLQSSHGMGLREALALGSAYGVQNGRRMPSCISAYAIGVKNPFEFGEQPCQEVSCRIAAIAEQIIEHEKLLVK